MFTPIAVMEMLAELHRRGYQRLRLSSGISPTGLNWRYGVAAVDQFESNGYLLRGGLYPGAAFGTTRGDDEPFGWEGTRDLNTGLLAELFIERYPAVAAAGKGDDADYKAWLLSALEVSRPDGAPVMYGEYIDVAADGFIKTADRRIPLPPVLVTRSEPGADPRRKA